MSERQILFSAPMVRAVLAGTKTQTRRVVRVQPNPELVAGAALVDRLWAWLSGYDGSIVGKILRSGRCPYGQPGDRLWVRETLGHDAARGHFYKATGMYGWHVLEYEREPSPQNGLPRRAIPSIHMPRWAGRITLEVTGVRVERLQDISEADAIAEGIERSGECNWRDYLDAYNDFTSARRSYRSLWESINGPGSWDANPWVWVVEFKRAEAQHAAA